MATSVGQINFGVGIDANGIAAELNRELTPALAAVQAKLNRKPLHVPIEIDTRTAIRKMQRELAMVRPAAIKVDVKVDLTETQIKQLRAAGNAIRRLESKSVRVDVAFNLTAEDIKRIRDAASAIRRLESKNVAVRFDINLTEAQVASLRGAASAIRRLESKTIVIRVDIQADEARLRALAEVLRGLRDRNLRVGVNVERGPVERLAASLGRVAKYTGIGAGIVAGLTAIVGAAGAAAGAIGGLVVGLASLGPALAAIGATAAVGFEGIGGAFSALSDISANAAADARTQAEAVESASEGVTSALDAQISAQQSLASAQESAADAAKAVGDAYKTAQERLDGYTQSLRESTLDQAEAELDLAEARKKLATGKFTDPLDRQRALLAVERAEINLQKAQKAGADLAKEANEAQEKGIDQADEVVAARKNQVKADQEVANAQRALQRSNEAVARAYADLAKAQSGAGSSAEKFSDALAKLAPNAQAFVLAFKDLGPTLKDLRIGVQDALFADLGTELTQTANVVLPAMKEGMQGVAGELNEMAKNAFAFLRSEEGMRGLNAAFEGGVNLLHGLRSGTGEFTQGLVDLTATAAPRMDDIGRSIAAIGEGIGRAFSRAAADGSLDKLLTGFSQVLASLGPLLDGVISAFITMGAEVLPALAPLFETLGKVIVQIAPSLGEIGAIFANSLTSILPVLGDLIKALADGLQPVLPVISMLLKTIGNALIPLIEPFSRIAIIVGETLISTLDALAPALEPLATAFADLLEAVAPLIPLLATELSVVIQALAPALSTVFNALGPVIRSIAEQMTPVIKQLAPILAQVAATIGQALADALMQLAPLLPPLIQAWGELILAIAPILPQLVDLAVQLLPPLISIIADLLPYLVKLIELFTWLVENVLIPLVIPIIKEMAQEWIDAFNDIAGVVHWFTDTLIPGIGGAFDWLKENVGSVVDWIGVKWAELKEKAAVPINFVIDTVLNNGLFKAWRNIDNLLGGVLPDVANLPLIPTRATGGPLNYFGSGGSGNGTKDDILFWGSNNEHVVTAAEVMKAGGQNIIYAIRDMIARGIPFTWDNGRIITELGRDNLNAYGAKVKTAGLGNVPPEGLFDQLARVPIPQFREGGKIEIFPWMHQLAAGHEFAKAQNGRPYKWAGPQFVGDSFDCSGFMGSIAAAILGGNPWSRYWATSSFAGYPAVGPQGFVKNLKEGSGFAVGVTDDPGGPGGGHTAGELRGIPELNIPSARVESGGAIGDVHYGRGTDPNTFASLYGLPIGANGFFEPAPGGSSAGPSPSEQQRFLSQMIEKMLKTVTDPVRGLIMSEIGLPPPQTRTVPIAVLNGTEHVFAEVASKAVTNLGSLLGGAWQRAKDLGSGLLDSLNPFDSGGIANGTGILTKNTIEPERILSPEQTALFEQLVAALTKIASTGLSAAAQAAQTVTVDLSRASVDALSLSLGLDAKKPDTEALDSAQFTALAAQITEAQAQTGELFSDTTALLERTASSQEEAAQAASDEQMKQLLDIANKLSNDVIGPIFAAAVGAGTDFLVGVIDVLSKDIVTAVNGTTKAVNNVSDTIVENGGETSPPSFGSPGSSFDAVSAVSDAVQTVANAATSAFNKVRDDIVAAALRQTRSVAGESRGLLGKDIDAGFLTNLIVQLTGVEIEVRDLLENTLDQITAFREGAFNGFTENGELISDTAAMVQRTATSMELAAAEQERIQKALIKAVIKYLIVNVLIPIITAILGAMITLATTAIGAAIGSAIPVIGTAIGAMVGAAVGAALAGLAAVFTSLLAVGAGAAIDAFDEGGIAPGVGMMPKNTIAPERVLSPRQTASFERLVEMLDGGGGHGGNRSMNVGSVNVYGQSAPNQAADRLLALLNT